MSHGNLNGYMKTKKRVETKVVQHKTLLNFKTWLKCLTIAFLWLETIILLKNLYVMSSKHCLCCFVYVFAIFIAKMLLIYDRNEEQNTAFLTVTFQNDKDSFDQWKANHKAADFFPRKTNTTSVRTTLAKCILHNKHAIFLLHTVKFR